MPTTGSRHAEMTPEQIETGRRRFRLVSRSAGVLLILSPLALLAWSLVSSSAANQVRILPGPGEPTCTKQDVRWSIPPDDEMEAVGSHVRMKTVAGASCQVIVTVVNTSGRSITVERASFDRSLTVRDRASGAVLITDDLRGEGPRMPSDEMSDAYFPVDVELEPDESVELGWRFVSNPHLPCSAEGLATLPLPTIRVSSWWRSHDLIDDLRLLADVKAPPPPDCVNLD